MACGPKIEMTEVEGRGIVSGEANTGKPSRGDIESMARRRFQDPIPRREGNWWYLLYWQDTFSDGKATRKRKRHKLAPADTPEREARKMAVEFLRPTNQGSCADRIGNEVRGLRGNCIQLNFVAADG
jgi:hypothetical protein